jgi:class 3 adenylate cyclase
MRTSSEKVNGWLKHRFGVESDWRRLPLYITQALQLNKKIGDSFRETYGKKEILCHVGFIDLMGFSSAVHGKSPSEVSDYLKPFLTSVIDAVTSNEGLVDKTIGDEVMFVFIDPDEEDAGPLGMIYLSDFLNDILSIPTSHPSNFQFRFGIAKGTVMLDAVGGSDYSEWTFQGETIAVAKRLMSIPNLPLPNPITGVYGTTAAANSKQEILKLVNQFFGLTNTWTFSAVQTHDLKGVGKADYIILTPQ